MSIPNQIDPMGVERRYYNWEPAVWTNARGAKEFSTEYLISDFIPIVEGKSYTYWGSPNPEVQIEGSRSVVLVYNSSKNVIDFWTNGTQIEPGLYTRTPPTNAGMAYLKLQILRSLWKKAKIVQGGNVIFNGADNPPRPL